MARFKPPFPRLSRGHPLARGLVAAYTFSEGSGNTLHDLSGNGNDGTLTNGPTWGGGCAGYALNFARASTQYVQMPKAPVTALPVAGIFRLKVQDFVNSYSFVASNSSGTNNDGWRLTINNTNGHVIFTLGSIADYDLGISARNNDWSLICFSASKNNGSVSACVDGKRASAGIGTMSGTPGQLWIGRSNFASLYYGGLQDLALIYNRTFDDNDFDLAQAEYGV